MRRYILSVQNSRPDGRLLEEAFRPGNQDVGLHTVYSAESALQHLRNPRNKLPLLILLGARFPGMSALDFVRSSKADLRLRGIPILVIGSYLLPDEVESFFLEHASSVIDMPGQLADLEKMLDLVKAYWLGIAGLNRHESDKARGTAP